MMKKIKTFVVLIGVVLILATNIVTVTSAEINFNSQQKIQQNLV